MRKIFQVKSIRTKMLFGFSLVLALVILLGIFNFTSTNQTNKNSEEILKEQLPILVNGKNLAYNTAHSLALVRGYILFGMENFKEEFNTYIDINKEIRENVLKINDSDEVRELFNELDDWQDMIKNEVFSPYDKGDENLAKETLEAKIVPLSRDILNTIEYLTNAREETIIDLGNHMITSGEFTLYLGIGLSTIIVLLGVIIAIFTSNTITDPIRMVMDRMQLIAEGDLSHEPI